MIETKQEFLETLPNDNVDSASQQIIMQFSEAEFIRLRLSFKKLDDTLFKGWMQQMTFEELKQSVDLVARLRD